MTMETDQKSDEPNSTESTHPEFASVEINTWGTHLGGGRGIAHFLDSELFGANCGHASLGVTFPADDTGLQLIQQYCFKDGKPLLPYERHTKRVRDPVSGMPKTIDVYTVFFSWWPAKEGEHYLSHHVNEDQIQEREGVDLGAMNPKFSPNYGENLEVRTGRGILGAKENVLSPQTIQHTTALEPQQKYLLDKVAQIIHLNERLESMGVLKNKLAIKEKTLDVTGTLLKLLNNFVPNWSNQVSQKNILTNDEAGHLLKRVIQEISETENEKKGIESERDIAIGQYLIEESNIIKIEALQIAEEVSALANPTTEAVNQIKSQHSAQAFIIYQMDENETKRTQIKAILSFLDPPGAKPTDWKTIKAALYHEVYPENTKPEVIAALKKWRSFLPGSLANLREEQMRKYETLTLSSELRKAHIALRNQDNILSHDNYKYYIKSDPFKARFFQSVLTAGLEPDNTLYMPVRSIRTTDQTKKLGLNVEGMLEKMQSLATIGGAFDLYTNNCSTTTGAILASGAEPELRSYFDEKVCGVFGTPQVVYNGAVQYHNTLLTHGGKIPLSEKINRANPLTIISNTAASMVKTYFDPKTSVLTSALLLLPVTAMGVLAGVAEVIKAAGNPRKTFNQCRRFMSYAWSNPSAFLKVCSVPVAALATVLAAPAAVQTGFTRLFTAVRSKPAIIEDEQIKRPPSPVMNKTITIEELDPQLALDRFHQVIESKNGSQIPVFEPKTHEAVNHYINQLDKADPDGKALMERYENDIQIVFKRVKSRSSQTTHAISEPSPNPEDQGSKFKNKINYSQKLMRQTQRKYNVTTVEKTAPTMPVTPSPKGADAISLSPAVEQPTVTIAVQSDYKGKSFQSDMIVSQTKEALHYDVSNGLLTTLAAKKSEVSDEERQAALNVLKSDFLFALTNAEDNMLMTIGQKYVERGVNAILIKETLHENLPMLDMLQRKNLTLQLGKNGATLSVNALIENIQHDLYFKPRR